jgi:cysteine-rich repeat protein
MRLTLTLVALGTLASTGCTLLVDGALGGDTPPPSSCDGVADGTPCMPPGVVADLICRGGVCTASFCGDGVVDDRTEECDDNNSTPGDGCEPDCFVTEGCANDDECAFLGSDCAEGKCDEGTGECFVEEWPEMSSCTDGTGMSGVCNAGLCVSASCGDGVLDAATEECDDGNVDPADGCTGCKADCLGSEMCAQDPCLGLQECVTATADNGGTIGRCMPTSAPIDCGDPACAYCDSSVGACFPTTSADADGDGYASPACGGLDCDDTSFEINPGRTEECDMGGLDVNCDPSDEPGTTEWFADCDGDGYPAVDAVMVTACDRPTGAPRSCPSGGYWTATRPVTGSLDCLDVGAAGRSVNPGQRGYFTDPYLFDRTSSFDYDCNGRADSRYYRATLPSVVSCGTTRCESVAPVLASSAVCGETATLYYCNASCTRYSSPSRYYVECH